MALLPVNTQSGVDAALSMSQTGLNTRLSAGQAQKNRAMSLDYSQKLAEYEEWASEDAKRFRATQQKLMADSAEFMSQNQELINSNWFQQQTAQISDGMSKMTANDQDMIASLTSPLMEAKTFEEASELYGAVYTQLQERLPHLVEQGAFTPPGAFSEESWKKAQIANMAAVRDRGQRQQLDLQNNQAVRAKELQAEKHDLDMKGAVYQTYAQLLLQQNEFEYKMELEMRKASGDPMTLANLGLGQDKLTHLANQAVPVAVKDIQAAFPELGDKTEDVEDIAKAVVADAMLEAQSLWDTVAMNGSDPSKIYKGGFPEVFSTLMQGRLDPTGGHWSAKTTGFGLGQKPIFLPWASKNRTQGAMEAFQGRGQQSPTTPQATPTPSVEEAPVQAPATSSSIPTTEAGWIDSYGGVTATDLFPKTPQRAGLSPSDPGYSLAVKQTSEVEDAKNYRESQFRKNVNKVSILDAGSAVKSSQERAVGSFIEDFYTIAAQSPEFMLMGKEAQYDYLREQAEMALGLSK